MIGEIYPDSDEGDSLVVLLQDTAKELRKSLKQNVQLLTQNAEIMQHLESLQRQVTVERQQKSVRRGAERVQVSLPTRVGPCTCLTVHIYLTLPPLHPSESCTQGLSLFKGRN